MKVGIVMGSKSDYPVVEKTEKMLAKFGVEYETRVISAHRTPDQAHAFAAGAEENGIEVIIAAAGKAVTPGGAVEICRILGKEETLRRFDVAIGKLTK